MFRTAWSAQFWFSWLAVGWLTASCGVLLEDIKNKEGSQPNSRLLPPTLSSGSSENTVYLKVTETTLTWLTPDPRDNRFAIQVYEGANCAGITLTDTISSATSYYLAGLVNGKTYSVSIATVRGEARSEQSACSPNFVIDLDAPTAPSVSTPASAVTINSNSYSLAWSASDVGPAGLHSTESFELEQFSNGTCAGAASSTVKVAASVYSLTGLADGQTYSVRIKGKDKAGNISASTCSAAITVNSSGGGGGGGGGSTIPAPTSFSLSDTSSTSTVYSNDLSVTVTIAGDGAATKWCLSEQQTARPTATGTCTGGGGPTNGWYTSKPAQINLSAGDSLKIVYLWIADASDVVSANALVSAITLDLTAPGAFNVAGITGGTDVAADAFLAGYLVPTVTWSGSTGASEYSVVVRNATDTADACPPASGLITTSYSFLGCTLTDATTYIAKVTSRDVAGNQTQATSLTFLVDNSGPSAFTITGLSGGGSDSTADAMLLGTQTPTVTWGAAAGSANYSVFIRNAADTADACSSLIGETGTSATFTGCTLTVGSTYKARVIAYDSSGNSVVASNAPFQFQVATQPGSFNISGLSGTGDTSVDAYLTSSVSVVVTVTGSAAAEGYDVVIKDIGNSTVCQVSNIATTTITVAGCSIADGAYTVLVTSNAAGGTLTTVATNQPFSFTKDTQGPTGLSILGVTGGTDSSADNMLTSGLAPTVNWSNATGEASYRYTIFEADGTTPACGPFNGLAANLVTHAPVGCSLVDNQTYKIRLYSADNAGNEVEASNSPYTFTVETAVDLILDGTGGSTLNGVLITGNGCTAGGACSSANPYSVPVGLPKLKLVKLQNSAYMTSAAWSSGSPALANGQLNLTVNGNLEVCATCKIHMDYRGYTQSNGPGSQPSGTNDGGSHGGEGGRNSTNTFVTYGSIKNPTTLGSGGAGNNGCTGGRGGGAILLIVTGQIKLNGPITALGQDNCWAVSSAGAGGSVAVQTYELNGTGGSISVNGGGGWDGRAPGAGGRVSLKYSVDTYTGGAANVAMTAYGGSTNYASAYYAGAGTIFVQNLTTETYGRLYVRNNNLDTPQNTPILSVESFDEIVISNQANLFFASTSTVTAPVLTGSTNGELRIEAGASYTPTSVSFAGGWITNWGTFNSSISTLNFGITNYGTIFLNTNLTITNGGTLELGTNTLNLTSVTIQNGGKLTHVKNMDTQNYLLDLNVTDLNINAGGLIDVSEKGYRNGYGPGSTTTSYAGASYGGQGGDSWSVNPGVRMATYGSIKNPNQLGSGGGMQSLTNYVGKHGGGYAKITVSGTLTLNGSIKANGSDNTYVSGNYGGSSGGTLNITTNILSGSGGLISANGGGGWDARGAGGGGRIALYYNTDSYTGGVGGLNFQAYGGTSNYGGRNNSAAGTVYYRDSDSETNGHLIVDNNNIDVDDFYYAYSYTPLLQGESFDSVTIRKKGRVNMNGFSVNTTDLNVSNNGYLVISSGVTMNPTNINLAGGWIYNYGTFSPTISNLNFSLVNFGTISLNPNLTISNGGTFEVGTTTLILTSLTIQNGGKLTHAKNMNAASYYLALTVGTLSIDSGGTIDVSERGYQNGYGPGSSTADYGGGSYGGQGGDSWTVNPGVRHSPYGTVKNPNQLGSGGGMQSLSAYVGKHGGGRALINVTGTLTLNGSIKANGSDNTYVSGNYGGSSGGSLHITCGTMAGSGGQITANGGAGWDSRGAGSGGRIALFFAAETYTGGVANLNFQTYGNTSNYGGRNNSAAGTVFYQNTTSDVNGHLIVDNNNVAVDDYYYTYSYTPLLENLTLDSVTVRKNGRLHLNGYSLTATTLNLETNGLLNIPAGTTFSPTNVNLAGGSIVNSGTYSPAIASLNFSLTNYGTINLDPNLTIASGGTLEVGTASLTLTSLTIQNGGKLTHVKNMNTQTYGLDLTVTNLTVNSGGTIDVSEKGYQNGQGPGSSTSSYAGASHGGQGGDSWGVNPGVRLATYGSVKTPATIGSGGGMQSTTAYVGKHGGGYARIDVSGTLALYGSIKADGSAQTYVSASYGAGAGGSLHIMTGTLTGSGGSITANGGSGWDGRGAGGGGRIALYYATDSYTGGVANLNFQAYGNTSNYGTRNNSAAGTVYYQQTGVGSNGTLVVDNNNVTVIDATYTAAVTPQIDDLTLDHLILKRKAEFNTNSAKAFTLNTSLTSSLSAIFRLATSHTISPPTAILSGSTVYNYGSFLTPLNTIDFILYGYGAINLASNLTIANGGLLYYGTNDVTVTSLLIQNGGKLLHLPNTTSKSIWLNIVSTTLTIDSGGEINVDGMGYSGSNGTGKGADNVAGNQGGGGGGYGGAGGASQQAIAGGATIQTSGTFDELGSGGGQGSQCAGGKGGGLVILNVSGTLTLNGKITADGQAASGCTDYAGGGGSGGAINLTTNTLAGSTGTLQARGGSGQNRGGGGGGGRIKYTITSDSYSGTISALPRLVTGGTATNGTAGSVGTQVAGP